MRHEKGSRGFKKLIMKVFAISDLHLSVNNPKPMDIFGDVWQDYEQKIFDDWKKKVGEDDIVLLPGDFSWAMKLEDTQKDFELIEALPGKKVIIRGNHDYWWKSISAVRDFVPEGVYAVQNDALKFENVVICGTRGWTIAERNQSLSPEDEKIYKREVLRLELTLSSAEKLRQEGDLLVCMMHYPPFNFFHDDCEMTSLMEKYKVDKVVYGHLHSVKNPSLFIKKNGIEYYLTSCDEVQNVLTQIV